MEKKTASEDEIEKRIRYGMESMRRKNLTVEQLDAEYRKYKGMYQAAVMENGSTENPYIWKEVYRRLLDGKK